MERLTKRDAFGNPCFKKCFEEPCLGMGCNNPDSCGYMIEVCKKLADYEDGRYLLLPKPGQEIWYITKGDCDRCPYSEECETLDRYPMEDAGCRRYVDSERWQPDGKLDADQLIALAYGEYFLTKEEAEAALEEWNYDD